MERLAIRHASKVSRMFALGAVLVAAALCWTGAACADDASSPEQAGAISVADGNVTATGADGTTRTLQDGSTFYAGDTITTGDDSYASLEFEDQASVTLRPDTVFAIKSFHFEPDAHAETQTDTSQPPASPEQPENTFLSLVKGGFRAVSGLIGHVNHDDYAIETPTATIGIRGTEYNVRYCNNDCADEAENGVAPDNGVYTGVDKGAIQMKNDTGTALVRQGSFMHAGARNHPLRPLAHPPAALRHMRLPPRLQKRRAANQPHIRAQRRQQWQKQHFDRLRRVQQHRPPPHRPEPPHVTRQQQESQSHPRPHEPQKQGSSMFDMFSKPPPGHAHPAPCKKDKDGQRDEDCRKEK